MFSFCDLVADSAKFSKLFYRKGFIYQIKTREKALYLTFDDGPTAQLTEWILRKLDQYKAKASFFILGKNAKLYPSLFQQIKAAGHTIGNHTYNHLKGFKVSSAEYLNDIIRANKILQSNLFRPPYGRITPSQARAVRKKLKMKIVLWTIVSCDYDKNVDRQKVWKIVRTRLKPGAIIVFHDSLKAEKNMRYALEKLLDYASEKGYIFSALKYETLPNNLDDL